MILRIDKVIPGGAGLGRLEGKAVMVPLTAPGDLCEVEPVLEKKDYTQARLVKILEASAQRVHPACPAYGICGGCDLMHLDLECQRKARLGMLYELFARAGMPESRLPDLMDGDAWGYRTRVQVHTVGNRAGFMGRSSASVIALEGCPVLDRALDGVFSACAGRGDGRRMAVGWARQGEGFFLEGRDPVASISLSGTEYRFAPQLFFQSNLALTERVWNEIAAGGQGSLAWDLYGGQGLFARALAGRFERVWSVESDARASEAGKQVRQGRPGAINFVASDCARFVTESLRAKAAVPELVFADPPRDGLDQTVREGLIALKPPKVFYLSCNPVTQARDARAFLTAGYAVSRLTLLDFYPQTSHMESLCCFALA